MVRLLIAVAAMAAALVSLVSLGAVASEAAESSKATLVVLVDESGSLTEDDFAEEVRAVRTLQFDANVDVYVSGFASEGSLDAVRPACEPGDDLAACSAELDRRTDSEGNDTDHAAALDWVGGTLDDLGPAAATPRIVILMTDGRFDPTGSGTPNSEDQDRLMSATARLQDLETQVWPLGFGDADRLALDGLAANGFQGTCDAGVAPHGVMVGDAGEVAGEVNRIIGYATCAPSEFEVSPEAATMIAKYGEAELGEDGVVTVTNSAGHSVEFACEFSIDAGIWVCEIPTEELGPGRWEISPPLGEYPNAAPGEMLESTPEPSTTVAPSTTASPSTTGARTTTPPVAAEEPDNSASPLLWVFAAIGALGLLILLWALLRDGSKLTRGLVAVRSNGERDWSPEGTVREQKRQAFEVSNGGYPSIESIRAKNGDVVLEATRHGIVLSGSMVETPHRIHLGDEVELRDGLMFTYTSDSDAGFVGETDGDFEDNLI